MAARVRLFYVRRRRCRQVDSLPCLAARAHARAHARTYAACEAGGHTQGAPVKTLVLFTAKQSDSNR